MTGRVFFELIYMSRIVDDLHRSAQLVKAIGDSLLPDGRSLSEALTIDGIPYWEVFIVELSRIYIPPCLSGNDGKGILAKVIRPNLVRAKYFARDLARLHKHRLEYSDQPASEAILCLDFSDHISRDVVQPVVRYLADHQDRKITCLRDREWSVSAGTSHPNVLRRTTWNFWCDELRLKARGLRRQLGLTKKSLIESKALEQIVDAIDQDLWGIIQPALNRLLIGEFSSLIRHGVLSRHILEQQRPSLVIAGDIADPRTRIYILQCKAMDIPCLALQFGMIGPASIEWRFFPADLVAVWGEDSKETLISHGVPSNQIAITGSPRNDSLFNFPASEAAAVKKKLGIPGGFPVVLLASTFQMKSYDKYSDPELLRAMKKAIFDSADQFNNVYLVVKPHPSEDENETKSFASTNPNIIFVSRTEDIRELIMICDCFISFGSTATVDALLLNRLVICPAFPGWVWSNFFIDTGAVHSPASPVEIRDVFKLLSTSSHTKLANQLAPARDQLVKRWIYRNDGLGAQRIANLALSLLPDSGNSTSSLPPPISQL
jgi:hypothetical protein